jgi:hypothetical protein
MAFDIAGAAYPAVSSSAWRCELFARLRRLLNALEHEI